MKEKDIKNFEKLTKLIEKLRSRYIQTLAAHKIFMELNRVKAYSYYGKGTADKNVKILKKYLYYFNPTKEGIRYYILIELAKFFEKSFNRQSLTIEHVLDYTEKNLNVLGKEHFKQYHKDREFRSYDIEKEYIAIVQEDIDKFRRRLKRNEEKIKRVKDYRDEYLAHDDLKRGSYKIKYKDISTLLSIVKDIVDFYYKKLHWASNLYENFEKEPVRNSKKLFSDLREFDEIERQKIMGGVNFNSKTTDQ